VARPFPFAAGAGDVARRLLPIQYGALGQSDVRSLGAEGSVADVIAPPTRFFS
jgi:hypothetical protein